jgi:hypothetical protein
MVGFTKMLKRLSGRDGMLAILNPHAIQALYYYYYGRNPEFNFVLQTKIFQI